MEREKGGRRACRSERRREGRSGDQEKAYESKEVKGRRKESTGEKLREGDEIRKEQNFGKRRNMD